MRAIGLTKPSGAVKAKSCLQLEGRRTERGNREHASVAHATLGCGRVDQGNMSFFINAGGARITSDFGVRRTTQVRASSL